MSGREIPTSKLLLGSAQNRAMTGTHCSCLLRWASSWLFPGDSGRLRRRVWVVLRGGHSELHVDGLGRPRRCCYDEGDPPFLPSLEFEFTDSNTLWPKGRAFLRCLYSDRDGSLFSGDPAARRSFSSANTPLTIIHVVVRHFISIVRRRTLTGNMYEPLQK